MDNITYTHKELAHLVNVSETTIKSYRKKIPDCLPISNSGKPIRFSYQALRVCQRIKELFSEGMAVNEVQRRLSEEFEWIQEPSEEKEVIPNNIGTMADVAIPLNAIAQGVMNILQQQKDVMRKLKELEDTIVTIQQNQVHIEGEQGIPPHNDVIEGIPQYLMEYPLMVHTVIDGVDTIEGLGLLPRFTLFDFIAKLNHSFQYPEHYTACTRIVEQHVIVSFIQQQSRNAQTFNIELLPLEHKGSTVLIVTGFYLNNEQTPIETLMGFIQM